MGGDRLSRRPYEVADYISLHSYYEQHGDDRASFLASAVEMDRFIDAVVATCDHVRAVGRHKKRLNLSFDEWNVWFQSEHAAAPQRDWQGAPPLIEDTYSVTDAVVVGNLLMSLLRRADRVKVGCLAQLVNVIAPIKTELGGPSWRQASFHPFALTSRYARGKGWIAAAWELSDKGKRAKYYRLTPLGRKQLATEKSKWMAFARAMGLILNPADQEGR